MEGLKVKVRVGVIVAVSVLITLTGLYGLLKPIQNGCVMTYMYPTYIPVPAPKNLSTTKYGLYLYHEGWKKIDYSEHLKKISGVPVLFIPGNGGSYKQVRSLAKESHWAYTTGPLERSFYQEASLTDEERGFDIDAAVSLPSQYPCMLDWFAVDLEGEHSAMDGRILKEHTEYVVYAIHRILDQYKESRDAQAREGVAVSGDLPKGVILVGHSMGGFVARAAIVHPHLRKHAVETVVTLSSPHQSPPIALQPSLGLYFESVNQQWRKGYEDQVSHHGRYASDAKLSHVIVISISGGFNDYQVRSELESLHDLVPPTHGFMISSTSMKNVWLSMEHQAILWCNQLVVQVSHAILSLVDPQARQPFDDRQRRLTVFVKMLRSSVPRSLNQIIESSLSSSLVHDGNHASGSQEHTLSACPKNVRWSDEGLERDLFIETTTVTILAMDGRRRWLDIKKLGFEGKSHFMLVTNFAPCHGVRIHLWPEKGNISSDLRVRKRVVEVTTKMIQIPSGPAPRQIEPGSQTEQPPPSAIFCLSPEDMQGFRFITISVAPRPNLSGRPPPAASMAVGQFFNSKEGDIKLSSLSLALSSYSQKDLVFKEGHPLALNLEFSVSLGLLPVKLSLKTAGCGIKNSGLPAGEAGDIENSRLCKLRCFPPVALAWDTVSGLHIYPNLHSETITVDSTPALWSSACRSEKTSILLLVDPHCSYKASYSVSVSAAASRFLLLYGSQVVGFAFSVVLFALMRQAHAWELDLPIPSMLKAVEYNMRLPLPFLLMTAVPVVVAFLLSMLKSRPFPPVGSFLLVSFSCYVVANGFVLVLVLISQFVFYMAGLMHVFLKARWQLSDFFPFKVVRALRFNPLLVTAMVAIMFVFFIHPALGLSLLLVCHALGCHNALRSFLTASFRSSTQRKEPSNSKSKGANGQEQFGIQRGGRLKNASSSEQNFRSSTELANSFSDVQLETFHHRHGLFILHFLAALMFGPSLVSWLQRIGLGYRLPWFADSIICTGIILHGICDSNPEFNFFSFPIPGIRGREVTLSLGYMLAGYYSFLAGLASAPYRALYAVAAIGVISFAFRIIQRRNREKGEAHFSNRKHSHRQ